MIYELMMFCYTFSILIVTLQLLLITSYFGCLDRR